MARKPAPVRLGIEPSQMGVPTMDRPSVALAWFLETMTIERDDEVVKMVCALCGGEVCWIEAGDDLRVLFNTALAHNCEG